MHEAAASDYPDRSRSLTPTRGRRRTLLPSFPQADRSASATDTTGAQRKQPGRLGPQRLAFLTETKDSRTRNDSIPSPGSLPEDAMRPFLGRERDEGGRMIVKKSRLGRHLPAAKDGPAEELDVPGEDLGPPTSISPGLHSPQESSRHTYGQLDYDSSNSSLQSSPADVQVDKPPYPVTNPASPLPDVPEERRSGHLLLRVILIRCTLLSVPLLNSADGTNVTPDANFRKIAMLVKEHVLPISEGLRIDGYKGLCYYWLGRAQLGLGNWEGAEEAFEEALMLKEGLSRVQQEDVQLRMGRLKEGRKMSRTVSWRTLKQDLETLGS